MLVGLLLLLAGAMAGCSDMDSLRSYERNTDATGDLFTFDVPEGTDQLRIFFSTKGSPASDGQAFLIIEGQEGEDGEDGEEIYFGSLGHGKTDEQIVQDPEPGRYEAILGFQGYSGPASVEIGVPSGSSTTIGPRGVSLGDNFWDILGVVLAVAIATGGWFLYRHHTKRLDREIRRIDGIFNELRSDAVDCRKRLLQLEEEFQQQLVRNKLKESHFLILEKRIERYLADLKEKVQKSGLAESPLEME